MKVQFSVLVCASFLVACYDSGAADAGMPATDAGFDGGAPGVDAGAPIVCGDGVVDGWEECDDGNLIDADGCEANCTLPACGNGVIDPGELCFDSPFVLAGRIIVGARIHDFDGDGDLDIVYYDSGLGSGTLRVELGDGTGRFPTFIEHSLPVTVGVPGSPIGPLAPFAVGDVTNDGAADVLIGDDCCNVVLVPGTRTGFGMETIHPVTAAPTALEVGDLDGTAGLDVVLGFADGSLGTLLSDGGGSLRAMMPSPGIASQITYLRLRRHGGDAHLDAFAASMFPPSAGWGAGDGRGGFGANNDLGSACEDDPMNFGLWGIDFADLDGDGVEDLVELGDVMTYVRPGSGTGFTTPVTTIETGIGMPGKGVAVGDFNGDTLPDVVAGNGMVAVLLGDGAGGLAPPTTLSLDAARNSGIQILVGDLNNDNVDDIVVVANAAIEVLLSNP